MPNRCDRSIRLGPTLVQPRAYRPSFPLLLCFSLLSHYHVLSIELGYHVDRQCDDRGNCAVERAVFHFVDPQGAVRKGEVVDLHLACQ